jgi:TolB-like protein
MISSKKCLRAGILGLWAAGTIWAASPQPEAQAAPAQSKVALAVLTFDGDQTTTEQQRAMLSDRLQMELMRTGKFTVLDRSKMGEILNEQGFQQSGACTNSDCQVEMGQMLGVEKLVTGKVVSFGPVWSLSANLIDVGSGRIETSAAQDVRGELFDVLGKGCPSLADQLAAGDDSVAVRKAQARAAATAAKGSSGRSSTLKWALSGGMIAAGIGMGAFGYLMNKEIQDKSDAYHALGSTATSTEFNDAREAAQKAQDEKGTLRTLGYAVGGAAFAGGLAVAIWF